MSTRTRTGSSRGRDGAGRTARQAWAPEVRPRVVQAVVEQGLAVHQVARTVGVPGSTVAEWVRKYRRGGRPALDRSRPGPPPQASAQALPPKKQLDRFAVELASCGPGSLPRLLPAQEWSSSTFG